MASLEQIAVVLQCSLKNVEARIVALKIGPVCGRCGGCGEYSFNQMDGSRCFGCSGYGHVKPKAKDLPAVLEEAQRAAADGRLERYVDGLQAAREAKAGSARIFAAWHAQRAARVLAGWGSHIYGHGKNHDLEVPGNFAEVRAANSAMCAACDRGHKAISAWEFPGRGAGVDRQALAIAARDGIAQAIADIRAADVEPSPELIAFVQVKQRASAERARARGLSPKLEVYGEEKEHAE